MNRRHFLNTLAGTLAGLTAHPAAGAKRKNIEWAFSLGLWGHLAPAPFTEVLDVMKETGFRGLRMTGFPGCLEKYDLTIPVVQKELEKRDLRIATISYGGPAWDETQHEKMEKSARAAMGFLRNFGATELVVFSPGRRGPGNRPLSKIEVPEYIIKSCAFWNHLGDVAKEYGFRAGLHNHLNQIVESQDEVEIYLKHTDPRRFHFSPDTAHLHLAGCDVVELFEKHNKRLIFMDYKDAKRTPARGDIRLGNGRVLKANTASATFMNSIYDLGDGEINFPKLHRILKKRKYKGWICVDLDHVRDGPRHSFGRSMEYVKKDLERIYS
jgi:sugar phosphate isomerase/epimerase